MPVELVVYISSNAENRFDICSYPDWIGQQSFAHFSKRLLNRIKHLLQQHAFIVEESTELSCLHSRLFTS